MFLALVIALVLAMLLILAAHLNGISVSRRPSKAKGARFDRTP
ncbi:hypothetical protein SF83666_c14630 [Sinorhizobium fredii CCBAU 83666]|nr:hypothetical protein SF83666_c14630 [Sinorhizobium fredii CCBAU 83666]